MSAGEELRRLLDELGIKHFDYSKSGWSQTQWEAPDGNRHFTYETYNNPAKTAKLVISWFPTPEHAIAATLGDDATAFAKRIEQAVESRKPLTLFGVDYEAVRMDKGIPQGAGGNLDQAQVEWLRMMPDGWDGTPPMLGNGECELEIKDNMNESEGTGAVWWECSSCHWQIEFFHTKWLEHAKFCPECGHRILKAVEP